MSANPTTTSPVCPTQHTKHTNALWQKTQWDRPPAMIPDATSHDGLNPTNVEPSAAPSASKYYVAASVDGPAKKGSSSGRKKSEELPHGERERERERELRMSVLGFCYHRACSVRKYRGAFCGLVAYS